MQIDFRILKRVPSLKHEPESSYGRQLEEFLKPIQNDSNTPMTKITPKSKSEVEFQYGGRPLSEIGRSFFQP